MMLRGCVAHNGTRTSTMLTEEHPHSCHHNLLLLSLHATTTAIIAMRVTSCCSCWSHPPTYMR